MTDSGLRGYYSDVTKAWDLELDRLSVQGLYDAWQCCIGCPEFEVEMSDQHYFFTNPVDFDMFNGVIRNRYGSLEEAKFNIARFKARFAASRLKALWWIDCDSLPAELEGALLESGLQRIDDASPMIADVGSLEPGAERTHRLEVRQVRSEKDLDDFVRVFGGSYGITDSAVLSIYLSFWKWLFKNHPRKVNFYLGVLGADIVACAQLILGGKVGGIWGVGTLPAARKQGFGTVLVARALQDAKQRDYRWSMLTTSEMGRKIYEKAGFRPCRPIRRYKFTP